MGSSPRPSSRYSDPLPPELDFLTTRRMMTRRTNPPTAQPMMRGRLSLALSLGAAVVAGASDVTEAAPREVSADEPRLRAAAASVVALPLVETNSMVTTPLAETVPTTADDRRPSSWASFAASDAPVTLPVALAAAEMVN
jgi:hypothetical protein